jgi:hypothetical protein
MNPARIPVSAGAPSEHIELHFVHSTCFSMKYSFNRAKMSIPVVVVLSGLHINMFSSMSPSYFLEVILKIK